MLIFWLGVQFPSTVGSLPQNIPNFEHVCVNITKCVLGKKKQAANFFYACVYCVTYFLQQIF